MGDARLLLGTSSWTADGWVGRFYADHCQPRDFLPRYAEHFNAVEIDSTFYRIPCRTMQPAPFEIDTLEVIGISSEDQERFFDAFCRWGHLQADLPAPGLIEAVTVGGTVDVIVSRLGEFRLVCCNEIDLPRPDAG